MSSCWRLQIDPEPMKLQVRLPDPVAQILEFLCIAFLPTLLLTSTYLCINVLCTSQYHAGNSVWNLSASERYLLSGDESGRVALWSLKRVKQNLYSSDNSVFPLQACILCCWHGAMQGSFQSFNLQQNPMESTAYVSMVDMGGISSSVWKVAITEVAPSAPSQSQNQPKSSSRRRRASVSRSGLQSAGGASSSVAADASTSRMTSLSMATTTTGGSSATGRTSPTTGKVEMFKYDANNGGLADTSAQRFVFLGTGLPPFVTLTPSLAQTSDQGPKDLARQVEVFPLPPLGTEQPSVELKSVVLHDEEYEPSCMELRVEEAKGKGVAATKKGYTLYVGMANGSIQKHSLRDE